jgi:class 3 adenylate cyclase
MVGFTSLASRLDPEDVRALQTEYFTAVAEVVHRWNGVVEKYIGDAVMAVFGVPRSDGYDAFRAVQAGMHLRETLRERFMPSGRLVQTRVGIATGEALVDLAAAADGSHGFISGDVVNTAARVQTHAAAGTVIVTASTYHATRSLVRYCPLTPATVVGKPEPLDLWQPLAVPADPPTTDPEDEAPLVGRHTVLNDTTRIITRALGDGTPRVISVVGEAGSGKSRLVRDLARRVNAAAGTPVRWQTARCSPDGGPPGALTALTDDSVAIRTAHGTAPPWPPTVLVIEDLHHCADTAVTGTVHNLITASPRTRPLIIIVTYRPAIRDIAGLTADHTVRLGPLSAAETALLLHHLLQRAGQPTALARRLLPLVCGNPMYAEAYVEDLTGRGMPSRRPDADPRMGLLTEPPTDLPTPEPVRAAVSARLDQLEPDDRAAVSAAAVLGHRMTRDALAFLLRIDHNYAHMIICRLENAGLINRQPISMTARSEYSFVDPAVGAVAYAQLPRTARADYHGRAAQWLDGLPRPTHATVVDQRARHWATVLHLSRVLGRDVAPYLPAAHRAFADAASSITSGIAPKRATTGYWTRMLIATTTPQRVLSPPNIRCRPIHRLRAMRADRIRSP